ncbi:MAG: hypothetical protein GY858_08545 [Candidatus Omnitrophica bacterium]|nr:hypothetical protein [Candidatus Omnitrophota bacterium]
MVPLSENYSFPVLKGLRLDYENPLHIEFIIDTGSKEKISEKDAKRLINYFLAGLTMAEKDIWVNLSPYEQNRILPDELSATDLGRDLLSQDYILKQLSASITCPDSQAGKNYWDKIYQDLTDTLGTTKVSINTFNKIWITPYTAEVYEHENVALINDAQLKAVLEEDFLARKNATGIDRTDEVDEITSNALRQVILPKINNEINQGKNFATLRQIYHSMVLATWFKKKFQDSFYKHFINQAKVDGIAISDKEIKQKVYNLYVEAFEGKLYDYIKKEVDPATNRRIKRRYFSGGYTQEDLPEISDAVPVIAEDLAAVSFEGNAQVADSTMISNPDDGPPNDGPSGSDGSEGEYIFPGAQMIANPSLEIPFEQRVQRVTLAAEIDRKSFSDQELDPAVYPPGCLLQEMDYTPKPTGMGTSGFRGLVDVMKDIEPYAITSGFSDWLVSKAQLAVDNNGAIVPGQKMVLAMDFRRSSPVFANAIATACRDLGVEVDFLDEVSTPIMAYYCQKYNLPGIMITGSHTAGKFNGLKLYSKDGEVLNEAEEKDDGVSDKEGIIAAVKARREVLYKQAATDSIFGVRGLFKPGANVDINAIKVNDEAKKIYIQRFVDAFSTADNPQPFKGYAVVYWGHSTVAVQEHVDIYRALGMKVIERRRRSNSFIALDTENMTKEHLADIKKDMRTVKKDYGAREVEGKTVIRVDGEDVILLGETSADGDGDRSMVIDENGIFWRGDVTIVPVARALKVDAVVQSLTGNQDVDDQLAKDGIVVKHCSVGSPYHKYLMRWMLRKNPNLKVIGQEVNGGIFIGPNIILPNGQPLDELITRDALPTPMIIFLEAIKHNKNVSEFFVGELDNYEDNAGLIHELPVLPGEKRTGQLIHEEYSLHRHNVSEVMFNDADRTMTVILRGEDDSSTVSYDDQDELVADAINLRKKMENFYHAGLGFGEIVHLAFGDHLIDGIVMWDSYGDRFHMRASGNAPELREYTYANKKADRGDQADQVNRADQIIDLATKPGGVLQTIEATVWEREKVLTYVYGNSDLSQGRSASPAAQNVYTTLALSPQQAQSDFPGLAVNEISLVAAGYSSVEASVKGLEVAAATAQKTLVALDNTKRSKLYDVVSALQDAMDDTLGCEGIFLALDMNAESRYDHVLGYDIGEDSKRFGEEANGTYVRGSILIELYELLGTDFSRVIVAENAFAKEDSEVQARAEARLHELSMRKDSRFVAVDADQIGGVLSSDDDPGDPFNGGGQGPSGTKQGSGLLNNGSGGSTRRSSAGLSSAHGGVKIEGLDNALNVTGSSEDWMGKTFNINPEFFNNAGIKVLGIRDIKSIRPLLD